MAGSLENRGKLRELIDKFQFVREHFVRFYREIFMLMNYDSGLVFLRNFVIANDGEIIVIKRC